jgi:hypothetical protein
MSTPKLHHSIEREPGGGYRCLARDCGKAGDLGWACWHAATHQYTVTM